MAPMDESALRKYLAQPPPPGYIPGLGRGAVGFTTRSDIGPARLNTEPTSMDFNEKRFADSQFEATQAAISRKQEKANKETDKIWNAVDLYMESGRKRRKKEIKKEIKEEKLQTHFSDLKRSLHSVTDDEWNAIPDVVDSSLKKKRPENTLYSAAPDSLLEKVKLETEFGRTTEVDLGQVGSAREEMLRMNLEKTSNKLHQEGNEFNTTDYMEKLSNKYNAYKDMNNEELRKSRLLLSSVRKTNPKHAPGWIAAARLEESAGKISDARKLILDACKVCPTSEDVWLEASRLNSKKVAKGILKQAREKIPNSVKIWLHSSSLEVKEEDKKSILYEAISIIKNSKELWKTVIEMENDKNAKLLLERAVICIPDSSDLWISLAHLEEYEKAKKILKKARVSLPDDKSLWIATLHLEETNNVSYEKLLNITLSFDWNRDDAIKYAYESEQSGKIKTCRCLIKSNFANGINAEDRKQVWIKDINEAINHKCYETARAMYENLLESFPSDSDFWIEWIEFEKEHGDPSKVLKLSIQSCPETSILWLMAAKEKWQRGDVPGARKILQEAFSVNPGAGEFWLAAAKLEWENNEIERARALLAKAQQHASSERVWIKSAKLEHEFKNYDKEKEILHLGLKEFPLCERLWLQLVNLCVITREIDEAIKSVKIGLENNPESEHLWINYSRIEENPGKARAILEQARQKLPKSDLLWIESINHEIKSGFNDYAWSLMAVAHEKMPTSGAIWALDIQMQPLEKRRSRIGDALRVAKENNSLIFIQAGRCFWAYGKYQSAHKWFEKATLDNPDLGDGWAWLYYLESKHGTIEALKKIEESVTKFEPRFGIEWIKVSKKDPSYWHSSSIDILKRVVQNLKEYNVATKG